MASIRTGFLLSLTSLIAVSCVDTKEVLVERELYVEPPTAAQGFLGYNDVEKKVPVCGSCHVGMYGEWKGTHHADAWATLKGSSSAKESCEGCHSVGGNGNFASNPAGWVATGEDRYVDVQCESCHGPGLDHVKNPDATHPYASIMVGVGEQNGCGECHQGTHHGFVDEWAQSAHANTGNSASKNAACVECHEARGVFEAWGIDAEYIEKDDEGVIPIVCAVCHDPHEAKNTHQLRFPLEARNVEQQLCMKCHHKRSEPDPNSSRGPHSPQGPLLLGEAGWRPPNFLAPTDRILGTHGSEANPKLCATCHVSSFTVTDKATGAFVFEATGHLFKAIPCLDDKGQPTANEDCALAERSFKGCTTSGCHGSADAARSAMMVARTRIASLAEELNRLVALVPKTEFKTGDNLITTGEGAKFNAGYANVTDMPGAAIHNPFLVEALLTASIKQVKQDYGLQTAPSIVLDNLLGQR